MNPYALLATIAVAVGLFGGGLTVGMRWEAGRQAIENQHIAEAVDAANNASAQAIAKIKVTNKTITNQLEKQIEKDVRYIDCRVDPLGMQLLNQAITGAKPAGSGKLPEADSAGK